MPKTNRATTFYRETCLYVENQPEGNKEELDMNIVKIFQAINKGSSKYGVFAEEPLVYQTYEGTHAVVLAKLVTNEGQGFGADFF